MRKILVAVFLFVLLAAADPVLVAQEECVPPPAQMVGWWPGDGNPSDLQAGNDGILVDGATFAEGLVTSGNGQAFSFDGVDDFVDIGDVDALEGLPQATFDLWMKTSNVNQSGSATAGTHLFAKSDFNISPFQLTLCSTGKPGFTVQGVSGEFSRLTADAPISADTWTFVVGVFDNSQPPADMVKLYIDGVLQTGTGTSAGCISTANRDMPTGDVMAFNDGKVTIGARDDGEFGVRSFFEGEIDEVEIFNRALSASEIQAIYVAGAKGKCKFFVSTNTLSPGVVGEFSIDQLEVSGGTAPHTWSIVDGSVPPGMVLMPDGVLDGVPLEVGDFTFTVRVTDSTAAVGERVLTKQVFLTQPGADLRIYKWGTRAVPGRTLDYFIFLENRGLGAGNNLAVVEYLEPWFTLISASPPVSDQSASNISWDVGVLSPGENLVLSYRAQLHSELPIGKEVTGGSCGGPQTCIDELKGCLDNIHDACGPFPWVFGSLCNWLGLVAICQPTFNACVASEAGDSAAGDCRPHTQLSDRPVDPNEKGSLANTFIQPEQRLVYPIHFENIGEIEALDVFVTDVLDDSLDESTLEILTPGGTYDSPTRTLSWDLIGINLQPGATGNVLFAVKPLPELAAGTEIENIAEIQFEVFDIIPTNEGVPVVNIIDDTLPECVVNPLPAVSTTTLLELSWTTFDAVGEPDIFDLFASVDGGLFEHVRRTSKTGLTFQAEEGRSYEFLCTAQDTAGNKEIQALVEAEAGPIFIGGVGVPPGVPSGLLGQAMTVDKLDPDGTMLSISWDTTTCTDSVEHHLIFGGQSELPTIPGGTYLLSGSQCSLGDVSPFLWTPDPGTEPLGFMWWLVVATDGSVTEGSWGEDSQGTERSGPGSGGASGQCGITTKDLTNTCGQ